MRLKMRTSHRWPNISRGAFGLLLVTLLPGALYGAAELTQRYPYDPACPWGRLSNGKGMIHRCVSQEEAESLGKQSATLQPQPEKALPKQKEQLVAYELKVGPISSKEGDITIGALHKPLERYRQCIDTNGGLSQATSKVVIQFLVRAERGRAEGVEVKSVKGMQKEAAQCLADVVDRRKVGAPSQEIMAVELTFEAIPKE